MGGDGVNPRGVAAGVETALLLGSVPNSGELQQPGNCSGISPEMGVSLEVGLTKSGGW